MSHRFPPLRPQDQIMLKGRPAGRTMPVPTPVDLTLFAALVLVVALALV
ncbi:hypothetical protein [Tabrizicola sp.]|nr:hypothetical protein [Tabrizicola sp.]MDP3196803.1 hypothetical protein [Tabrizicola sp.]